jgi:hypothetical protein
MNPVQVTISICLIMTSVLLGFQVDRWSEQRRKQELETVYLERMRQDLSSDAANLERRVEYFSDIQEFGLISLSYLNTPEAEKTKGTKALVSFYLASHAWKFNPSNSTFQELKSSGKIPLIESISLRSAFSVYYQELINANYIWDAENLYRVTIRSLIPMPIQEIFWYECHDLSPQATRQTFNADCQPDIDPNEVLEILTKIESSPDVEGHLNYLLSNVTASIDLFKGHQERALEIIEMLDIHAKDKFDLL